MRSRESVCRRPSQFSAIASMGDLWHPWCPPTLDRCQFNFPRFSPIQGFLSVAGVKPSGRVQDVVCCSRSHSHRFTTFVISLMRGAGCSFSSASVPPVLLTLIGSSVTVCYFSPSRLCGTVRCPFWTFMRFILLFHPSCAGSALRVNSGV